uniref:Uncharacterized protein n=1 Tax=Arundo donax TaxID=35708 RepID=A0A0A8YY40_ARUDO
MPILHYAPIKKMSSGKTYIMVDMMSMAETSNENLHKGLH